MAKRIRLLETFLNGLSNESGITNASGFDRQWILGL